jgi:tetratricopeptide (TPR) repeat protein
VTALAESLALALRHYQGGRLQAAEQLYRQILAAQPDNATALYNLGLVFKDQGQRDEAACCWRRAAQLQPDQAATHNNLGNILREQGQFDEAVACFRRAIELQPGVARFHYNLGNALRDQEKLAEAAAAYRRALALAPDYAEAHSNLGNVLRRQGKLDEAVAAWQRAIELKPDFAEAHFNLSVAYTDQEKFPEAMAACRRALLLKPDFAAAHNNLGHALRELGNLDEAVACCRRALELEPDLAAAHNNLGNALKDRGEWDAALICYRRAIELDANFTKAHYNLGVAEEETGDFQRAEACFRRALACDARFAPAHYNLAKLLRGKLADNDLAAQRRLLAANDMTDSQRMLLHFGLAQVLDARGEYAAAAEHLERANALQLAQWRRRGRAYDPQAHELLVARLTELCTPGFFQRTAGFGLESELPVFIVGLPRSGTTLIEQILAAHSKVFAAGEIKLVHETLIALARPGGDLIGGLRQMDRQLVQDLAARHLARLSAYSGTALRVVDKLPENYLYLGPLAVLFPRAKFIHCRRDLRDVALSCWMTHFQEVRWANDRDHILSQFREHQRIMEHWRKVLPARLLEVDYEETVANLEAAARRLVEFCGLAWEPGCLRFYEAKRPVSTASAVQVRQPAYDTSVHRWNHYARLLESLFARLPASRGGK